MITLKTLENTEEIKELFQKEELLYNQNSNCLCAKDREDILGYCLFDIDSEKITVRAIEPQDDISLCDGILRSTLHVAHERGIVKAYYADKSPENIFEMLRFIKSLTEKSLDINKLFESCCGCK